MALRSIALLALVALCTGNPVKRADLEHGDPIGSEVGSRLTPAPTADSKLRSVLLALAKKDTESPKNQDSGDYLDNPRSAVNMMLALARRGDAVKECLSEPSGKTYRGSQTKTRGGYTCQAWASQTPNKHDTTPAKYPGRGLEGNACRNPRSHHAAWCYTTDDKKRWDYCTIKACTDDDDVDMAQKCINNQKGADYRGVLSKTVGGYTCQKWSSQSPNQHHTTSYKYPNKGIGDHNYCRNPNNEKSLWCYTDSKDKRWDVCSLPICTNEDEEEEDADWCKYEGVDLKYILTSSMLHSAGVVKHLKVNHRNGNIPATATHFVGTFTTLAASKTACSKYSECTGITKYGTTNFRLVRTGPYRHNKYDKDTSRTSWTKCPDNGYRKQMEGLIKTLDTTLAARLEHVKSLKKMASFSADDTNSLQLLQLDLLKKVKAQSVGLWPVTLDCSDPTVNWILNDITALQTLTLSGPPLKGKWKEAVLNLAKLIKLDGGAKSGMKLKLAVGCALTFAEPVHDMADYKFERTIDMVSRYQNYLKWSKEGVLFDDFKTLNAWQYRYVVGAWRQDSELVWARKNVLKGYATRDKIGSVTHRMVAYTSYNKFGVTVQHFADYYADNVTDASTGKSKLVYRDVTMALVAEVGGVCGAISKFGVHMAQAFGLPAMPVGQPGHCAFIWYRSGKWALANDISGWAGSTTHHGIAAAWVGMTPGWVPLMDAAQKNDKFWLTQKMEIATRYKSDMGLKFAILEKVTEWCPQNWGVWMDLIETLKNPDLIKDASDSFLDTITKIRKDLATVSNLAPSSSVTASKSVDSVNHINDLSGSTSWTSKETTAWVEIDLQGVCDISSVEIQWWGCSIASDYDILIQGPDNKEWTKVLSEEDAASSPAFNGWSKLTKGWSQDTTKIRLEMRAGKMDHWGYKAYFGIRSLVVNGVRYDDNVVIAQSKEISSGGDIDLIDICALSSIEVTGSGTVTVSTSTDGISYSVIASGEVKGEASIALSGVATNVRLAVKGGEVSEVSLKGVRYTVKDLLKIQAKEDLADNIPVYSEIMKRIDKA